MSKIITITDDLYERLKSMKRENESFSKVIARSVERKGNKEEVMKMVEKHSGAVKKAFEGVDSVEYVKEIRKNWNWDRYAK